MELTNKARSGLKQIDAVMGVNEDARDRIFQEYV